MILASSQAKILLSQSDKPQIRQFLKNVGLYYPYTKRMEVN